MAAAASEPARWAGALGRAGLRSCSLRGCLQNAPNAWLVYFNQVYFKVSLTVTSCAGSVSYHAVRCAHWIQPIQSSEGYFSLLLLKCLKINRGFEPLSKVRGWWIRPSLLAAQQRAHGFSSSHVVRRRWRKLCGFLSLLFPIINFKTFWHVMISVARKEDCFWLYVLQRIHGISLVGEIMGPS